MLQFGCHIWGFNDKPFSEALATIARMGFRYVDLGTGPHLDGARAAKSPKHVAAEFQRELDRFGLNISDLYLMFPRISSPDVVRRDHEIKVFESLMPFAAALKTPGITVSPGIVGLDSEAASWRRATEALRRWVSVAAQHNLPLSIEPHIDSLAATPERALRMLAEVEGLQITLDWAHMAAQGYKPDSLTSLLPYTRHVQIRQAAPRRMQTPFEQGVLDMQRVMALLLGSGYNTVVTIEVMQTIGWGGAMAVNTVQEALQQRDALRTLRDQFILR